MKRNPRKKPYTPPEIGLMIRHLSWDYCRHRTLAVDRSRMMVALGNALGGKPNVLHHWIRSCPAALGIDAEGNVRPI